MDVVVPFVADWSCPVRWLVGVTSGLAALAALRAIAPCERVMKERGTGNLGFQRRRGWAEADATLAAWGEEGRAAARASLRWDTRILVPAYVTLLVTLAGSASAHARDRDWPGWAAAATLAALAYVVAAVCDWRENYCLHRVLDEDRAHDWPGRARNLSTAKWSLLGAGSVVLVTCAVAFAARG